MRRRIWACAAGLLWVTLVGCTPPPATQPPEQQERIEVDVNRDAERDTMPPAEPGVDVQIGGGEGVDVMAGTDVGAGEILPGPTLRTTTQAEVLERTDVEPMIPPEEPPGRRGR